MTAKESGVIMRDREVRALLAGAKTLLVRPCAVQPVLDHGLWHVFYPWGEGGHGIYETEAAMRAEYDRLMLYRSPFGGSGDALWVKESWAAADRMYQGHEIDPPGVIAYFADKTAINYNAHVPYLVPAWDVAQWNWDALRKRSSTQMPRWASRITLEVTRVRVERLQNISEDDAKAEGLKVTGPTVNPAGEVIDDRPGYLGYGSLWHDPRRAFETIWNSINRERAPWSSNPWVWVVEFKRVEQEAKAA